MYENDWVTFGLKHLLFRFLIKCIRNVISQAIIIWSSINLIQSDMSVLILGLTENVFEVGWFGINAGERRFIEYQSVSHFLGKSTFETLC